MCSNTLAKLDDASSVLCGLHVLNWVLAPLAESSPPIHIVTGRTLTNNLTVTRHNLTEQFTVTEHKLTEQLNVTGLEFTGQVSREKSYRGKKKIKQQQLFVGWLLYVPATG